MRELAKHATYIALSVWVQTGGPIDQELVDLVFWLLDMYERNNDGHR